MGKKGGLTKMLVATWLAVMCFLGTAWSQNIWDGTIDTSWYTGPDAQSYSISTAEHLAGLAHLVNRGNSFEGKTITLTANIFLNDTIGYGSGNWNTEGKRAWIPIGTSSHSFRGQMDGFGVFGNRKIYGLYIPNGGTHQGLFGSIGFTISNFDILCGEVNGTDFVGGLAGRAGGNINYVNSDIAVNGVRYVGGIVGAAIGWSHNNGSEGQININYVEASGNVTGVGDSVGGLVGYMRYCNIISSNHVGVKVSGNNYVGGLAGDKRDGNITSSNHIGGIVSGNNYVGGLVGYASVYYYYWEGGKITSSNNIGGIVNGNNYVGGLLGYADVFIESSHSVGDVNGRDTVGGLLGFTNRTIMGEDSDTGYTVFSKGNVIGNNFVGGLVGYVFYHQPFSNTILSDSIVNAYSIGDVEGASYVGGLVGANYGYFFSNQFSATSHPRNIINTYSQGRVQGSGNFVGGLVGEMRNGWVGSSNHTNGEVRGNNYVGGLVGRTNDGVHGYSISDITGQDNVGGLVGRADGGAAGYSIGNVSGRDTVGGLVGYTSGSILGSSEYETFSKGKVAGNNYVGGLIGFSRFAIGSRQDASIFWTRISGVHSIGDVEGASYVGGLIGANHGFGQRDFKNIENSYSQGKVLGSGDYVGGLVGRMVYGSIRFSNHSDGKVNGNSNVGGLVGAIHGHGIIESSNHSGGGVSGNNRVGGLVGAAGWIDNACGVYITDCYSTEDVKGIFEIGGLVGYLHASSSYENISGGGWISHPGGINNSHSLSNVIGDDNVGGLVGSLRWGLIQNSYAKGNVVGDLANSSAGNDNLGGLVGYAYGGRILRSFATGDVSGATRLGGLVGRADDLTVNQAYARGNVSANVENPEAPQDNWIGGFFAGGLVGHIGGTCDITEAYSTGKVTVVAVGGGFVGNQETGRTLNLNNCYFDMETSGQTNGVGNGTARLTGNTTAEMKTHATFIEWDFSDVWGINGEINDGYPFLRGIGNNGGETSISDVKRSDSRHGIRFAQNIVGDKAEISVVLPDASTGSATEISVVVYDMTGNVVFERRGVCGRITPSLCEVNTPVIEWDLRNTAGRFVANGAYLVIAEVKDRSGRVYQYSARLGVKR